MTRKFICAVCSQFFLDQVPDWWRRAEQASIWPERTMQQMAPTCPRCREDLRKK